MEAKLTKTYELEVRTVERTVKNGKEKGKKFNAYQVFNKKTGYYEELRFNSKVKNQPSEEGSCKIEVDASEVNRQGTARRKYPLTWVSKINKIIEPTETSEEDNVDLTDDLPF